MIITFFRYIYFESLKCLLTHNDGRNGLRHSARAEEERSGKEVEEEEEESEGIKDRKSIQSLEIS